MPDRGLEAGLGPVRVILVRPEEAGNVGAAARVLKNFGLGHLVLVAPRLARPEAAFTWAHGAHDVLEGAEVLEDLQSALAPCSQAWAATRRRGKHAGGSLPPREAARRTASLAASGQQVAWVFGPESRGLSRAETALCSRRVVIPTSARQPSLNLAQAVAVCLYETHLALLESPPPAARRQASIQERRALYLHLQQALLAIGFLHPHTASARMAGLRAILERAALDPREVRLLRGLARQAQWAGQRAEASAIEERESSEDE